MMNAGVGFHHEESTPDGPVEMLQIFVRPSEASLPARVRFHERPDASDDSWRLVAGPDESQAPLRIRQRVIVYDAVVSAGREVLMPDVAGLTPWLYVMDGAVGVGSERLSKGDAATNVEAPFPPIRPETPSTLVAFLVDLNAAASGAGTISGR